MGFLMVLLALALAGPACVSGSPEPSVQHSGIPLLEGEGEVSFESLGWDGDALLTGDGTSPVVSFRLPDGAVQGDPLWYGIELHYQWTGIRAR